MKWLVEHLRSPCLLPVWTAIRLAHRKGHADGDQRRTDAIYAQRVRADWTSVAVGPWYMMLPVRAGKGEAIRKVTDETF
jgi:hypothetical protein